MNYDANAGADNNSMDYWNDARINKVSTDSEWMTEVYDDSIALIELANTKGVSDELRLKYTTRAMSGLQGVCNFLTTKGGKEDE